jgi:hypothetical protein
MLHQRTTIMSNEVLRDRNGNKLAEVETNGYKRILRDKVGNKLGEYDSRDGKTRDKYSNVIGNGDLLLTLLG